MAERRYAFVGAGGIGGLIGTWMARAGCDVTFVERWTGHATAIDKGGVKVSGARGKHHVRVPAITPEALERLAPLDTVVVAVKSHDTREALEQLLPFATDNTLFVSMQAGMNLYLYEAIVGRERTVAANPHFGGALIDPGMLEAGFPNYVWIGELDGSITPRIQQLQQDLLHWGPTQLSDNILGVVWSKFCYGSQTVMSSVTAGPSGLALDAEIARLAAGELVREAIAVAEGLGVELVAFDFFDPDPYRDATPEDPSGLHFWIEHAWPRHEVFRAPSFHQFVKTGSGMTWDLTYRNRKTETGARIEALRHHAQRAGVAIPFNELLWEVIRGIEQGERPLGAENLDALAAEIAAAGGPLLTTALVRNHAAVGKGT
jgi:2-dehydropantoate 2-reductase